MAENVASVRGIPKLTSAERIKRTHSPAKQSQQVSFDKIFENKKSELAGVRFSQHAQNRLRERNITMSSNDYVRLRNAMHKISEKGGRESLVLMDNQAFLVSAENRTVITAIDGSNMRESVFTNIDSAIII